MIGQRRKEKTHFDLELAGGGNRAEHHDRSASHLSLDSLQLDVPRFVGADAVRPVQTESLFVAEDPSGEVGPIDEVAAGELESILAMDGGERELLFEEVVVDLVAVQPAANGRPGHLKSQLLLDRTRSDQMTGAEFGLNVAFDVTAKAWSRLLRAPARFARLSVQIVDHSLDARLGNLAFDRRDPYAVKNRVFLPNFGPLLFGKHLKLSGD